MPDDSGDAKDRAATYDADALRQDLNTEYYAIVRIVGEFDGRLLTMKSWSVTLSLAAIGLGFQQSHYALFALAAGSAVAFWLVEAITKRHQMRYYPRMREIEVDTFGLNRLQVDGVDASAPRIDWAWTDAGRAGHHKSRARPTVLTDGEITRMLHHTFWMPHVCIPHAVAVVVGVALFAMGAATPWLNDIPL
ncbi:MAG TPA: hypothetical protein VH419_13575 [Nocardioidaceae bacterium]|jgi:hypothetical protein